MSGMPPFDGRRDNAGRLDLTHEGTSGSLYLLVRNGWVYVEGAINISMTSGVNVPLLVSPNEIPEPYRPPSTLWVPGRCNAGTLGAQVGRNADGTIGAIQNQGSTAAGIQFAYSYPQT